MWFRDLYGGLEVSNRGEGSAVEKTVVTVESSKSKYSGYPGYGECAKCADIHCSYGDYPCSNCTWVEPDPRVDHWKPK